MSTLGQAIDALLIAVDRADQLYIECPRDAVAERHVIRQASIDLGSALAALRRLQQLDEPMADRDALL